jgi:hypothetical protein
MAKQRAFEQALQCFEWYLVMLHRFVRTFGLWMLPSGDQKARLSDKHNRLSIAADAR